MKEAGLTTWGLLYPKALSGDSILQKSVKHDSHRILLYSRCTIIKFYRILRVHGADVMYLNA